MPVHTVLGPIDPEDLGPTSMHEHIIIDCSEAFVEEGMAVIDEKVTIARLGDLHWNAISNIANLRLDEPDISINELKRVKSHGGQSIVDVTPIGLGRRVDQLQQISSESDVNIILGVGIYRDPSHPDWVENTSAEDIASYFIGELQEGIGETGVLPSIIGEIGTIDPVTDQEWKVLEGAAKAAKATGASISVHLDPTGQYQALEILECLVTHGASPDRIIFGHVDEILMLENHRAIMDAGATIEYDLFGMEFYYPGRENYVTDYERMETISTFVNEGRANQIVLACDVHCKMMLSAYGGMGYSHLIERIVPMLSNSFGLSQDLVNQMLVKNPARLLNRP